MVFLENFFRNVRKIYMEQGLTQEQAAARCKITPQYLRQIMNGEKVPSMTVFMNICIGLGTSPYVMLGYDPVEFEKLCAAQQDELMNQPIKKNMK